jgi:hypothetical protein
VNTTEYVLWWRATRKARWEPVANADSFSGALDQIGTGDRGNGDWIVREKGLDPDAEARPR